MSNPIELPSLEEIEQTERQRSQAIEALEISDGNVKCQRCQTSVPIGRKLTSHVHNDRIDSLQRRIKWIEDHHDYFSSPRTRDEDLKELKQELVDLQAEDSIIKDQLDEDSHKTFMAQCLWYSQYLLLRLVLSCEHLFQKGVY
jgi:hypothetical protein